MSCLIALLLIVFATWHLVFVDRSPPLPFLPSGSLPIWSSPRVTILQTIFIPPTTSWSCFISLFGQGWPERPIYRASVRGHERYAATWGYGYALETRQYVPKQAGVEVPFLNKVHALLRLAREELQKGDAGAEWVLTADSDTLILDPSIPLTHFLPPIDQHPAPSMLANQDHNGLNAGVFFWRITPRLISFLEALLSYEPAIYAATGRHASDQHLTGYALQHADQADFARGFYEIPQRWVNGYFVPSRDVSVMDDAWEPAAFIHLVNWRKWQEDWKRTVIGPAEKVYEKALKRAEAENSSIVAALMDTAECNRAKDITEGWWRYRATAGTENMVFNEY